MYTYNLLIFFSQQALSNILQDVYRVLKQAVNSDSNQEVRVHASLALGELDEVMREVLFPPSQLRKTITILGHQ